MERSGRLVIHYHTPGPGPMACGMTLDEATATPKQGWVQNNGHHGVTCEACLEALKCGSAPTAPTPK